MRAWLYGSLAALAAVVTLAVVLGEASEGSLTGLDVALALAGFSAMVGAAFLAVVAVVYEVRRWRQGRKVGA
jgi:hypothetical protein